MTEFDPEKFEDKYEHYFPQLQRAYREAFDAMNGRYNSELIHAIDQGVLSESEPFYEGDGEFRVELPENPKERLGSVQAEADVDAVLEEYTARIEAALRGQFGFDEE